MIWPGNPFDGTLLLSLNLPACRSQDFLELVQYAGGLSPATNGFQIQPSPSCH